MTDNELKENEFSMIARFMGMKPQDEEDLAGWWTNTIPVHPYEHIMFDGMKFNTSFDWLMPVCEKIEEIIGDGANFIIGNRTTYIMFVPKADVIRIEGKGETKIEAIYNAVIQYIKWYNQNK